MEALDITINNIMTVIIGISIFEELFHDNDKNKKNKTNGAIWPTSLNIGYITFTPGTSESKFANIVKAIKTIIDTLMYTAVFVGLSVSNHVVIMIIKIKLFRIRIVLSKNLWIRVALEKDKLKILTTSK